MPQARPKQRKPALTHDSIVQVAAEILEEGGLDALTMRSVAQRLGAQPMSLYRYIATKDELLLGVAELLLADIELPDTEGLGWRETITEVTHAVHRAFLAHPHLSAVLGVQHVDSIAIFRGTELILRALREAGLTDLEAVRALDVITAFATGFTQRRAELRKDNPAPDRRLSRIRRLSAPEFATVIELAGLLVTVDVTTDFPDALAIVLDGVAGLVNASAARRTAA